MRKLPVGSGTSSLHEAGPAGEAAARAAVAGLNGADPGLVIVYSSIRYDLPGLLAGIRGVTGDAPLVGATSCGQFTDGEFVSPAGGVSVLVLGAGVYRFGTASVSGLSAGAAEAGQDLARRLIDAAGPAAEAPHGAIMVLADGMAGDPQALLTGIYRVTGARIPIVGGAASDDRTYSGSSVLHGDRVIGDGAVAVWIGSDDPLHVVSGHGWRAHGLPMLVTRAEGHVIHEIDGRPANDVYDEAILAGATRQAPPGAQAGWHTTQSFGLIESDGTQAIRGVRVDEQGDVRTFSPVPEFSAVQIVSADQDDLLDVSERVIADALRPIADPAVILMFSCVARIDLLAEREAEEAARLHKAAGPVATFGFYTYGEFARTAGVSGYHNATLAALAL